MHKDPLELAQLIVRGTYINLSSEKPFEETSGIYRFTNEDITSYFHHLKNKENVLSVISSGSQILNSILAGSKSFDCFDISMFPEYYLYLQIASIISLSKEDYLKYYFSDDREELFCDELYDKISPNLKGRYKEFWDTLYNFDEGIDIYESLLFRHDLCVKNHVIDLNPYLQDKNYEKLRHILQTEYIRIIPFMADITKTRFAMEYDLVNLSNILPYYFKDKNKCIEFLRRNFSLSQNGEIINYLFSMNENDVEEFRKLLNNNSYIEDIKNKKILIYKK